MLARFDSFVRSSSDWFANAGAVLLIIVFVMSVIDVIGAKSLSMPVPGVTEFVGHFQSIFIALAIGLTQLMRQHISVSILTDRMPKSAQNILMFIISVILLILFGLLIWQMTRIGLTFQAKGQYSITVRMPLNIFAYCMAFAFILPFMVFLLDSIKYLKEIVRK